MDRKAQVEGMLMVQKIMDDSIDYYWKQVDEVMSAFGVSEKYAKSIVYLRSRSRWTPELESQLIQMCRDDEPCPNMCEWPPE